MKRWLVFLLLVGGCRKPELPIKPNASRMAFVLEHLTNFGYLYVVVSSTAVEYSWNPYEKIDGLEQSDIAVCCEMKGCDQCK